MNHDAGRMFAQRRLHEGRWPGSWRRGWRRKLWPVMRQLQRCAMIVAAVRKRQRTKPTAKEAARVSRPMFRPLTAACDHAGHRYPEMRRPTISTNKGAQRLQMHRPRAWASCLQHGLPVESFRKSMKLLRVQAWPARAMGRRASAAGKKDEDSECTVTMASQVCR